MLISILTVSFNNYSGLVRTVKSVKEQDAVNYEHIIIDGGSRDPSLEYLKKSKIQGHWISEPDAGIYDAMNKGLELCSGDYVIMLNAGDVFADKNVLKNIFLVVKEESSHKKAIFGRAIIDKEGGNYRLPPQKYNEKNMSRWLKYNVPNHQAMFFPKQFYLNNRFDLRLSISADFDYKMRALKEAGYEFVNLDIVKFKFGGISSSYSSGVVLFKMVHDTWINNTKHKNIFVALYRVSVHIFKFFISKVFGKNLLFNLASIKSR